MTTFMDKLFSIHRDIVEVQARLADSKMDKKQSKAELKRLREHRGLPFLTRSAVAACVDRSALRENFGELVLQFVGTPGPTYADEEGGTRSYQESLKDLKRTKFFFFREIF